MKGRKHVYRVMWEDDKGYRDGKYRKVIYDSKPKGKMDKGKRRKKR